MFAVVITGYNDHLGMRRLQQNIFEHGETFTGAVRIRRQAEIKGNYRGFMLQSAASASFLSPAMTTS